MRLLLAVILSLTVAVASATAQEQSEPVQDRNIGILTIEPDRLYQNSRFGRRILAEIETARQALISENERLDAELSSEELALANRRSGMDPTAFRRLANTFDLKVESIRAAQDEKLRLLTQRREDSRQVFFDAVLPVLAEVTQERQGLVVLERRMVFVAADSIDITDEVIARIDARIGDGFDLGVDETPEQPQEDQ